ncbi:hypothetical protein ABS772_17150 [Methylorubrum podarium]|uniref:Uncharacterized protein n=1 Tax=Methylorubrum podarium TaxID=200476 RepID=A0ABV1QQF3_9HYPH
MGNAAGARLDHVRPVDLAHFHVGGVVWVRAGTGGISTFANPRQDRGRWWRLPAGYDYGPLLLVENDHGDHWSWEPGVDMPLSDYRSLLMQANLRFR